MDSGSTPTDVTDLSSNHAALQQMYELETIRWRGGESHYKGPHDNFCFVCGGERELFGCETCENCYHASCMSPGLQPAEVPSFWFCPHCVNNELHIPPGSPTSYFTPVTVPGNLASQSSYFSTFPGSSQAAPQERPPASERDEAPVTEHAPPLHSTEAVRHRYQNAMQAQPQRDAQVPGAASSRNIPTQAMSTGTATATATATVPVSHGPRLTESHQLQLQLKRSSRHKRSRTPPPAQPRKKSKYSAFSADVDKALSVIRNELEAAAAHGKSADHLRDEVESLKQQLKLQDGQLALTRRELEIVKRDLKSERERGREGERQRERERVRNDQSAVREEARLQKEEIRELRELVAKKDGELRDWKGRLRAMIGGGLEER